MTANTTSTLTSTPSANRGDHGGGGGGGLDLVAALWIFGAPLIFTVGIAGNALVLAVTSSIVF